MLRIVAAFLSAAILMLADSPVDAQTKELIMGNVNPPKHGTSLAAQQFADKLAELSGGKIKVVAPPLRRAGRGARGRAADPARHGRFRADHDGAAVDAGAGDVGVPAARTSFATTTTSSRRSTAAIRCTSTTTPCSTGGD